ncbi:anti-sigma factor antagonist [Treponema sp. J25]|uniref:anti-sigma factor antagonist n=1 Tax=Treponema sp. J25 TaxID=2094121 RepID=UPI00104A9301|nr:anti-sigma factor antagonist [Treponema sp. J25]MCX7655799.1 anti-sigma factor antagonist [Treponemataceae bacterium]TCW61956.1 anti-sigma F factor antagonist [Treponema sp. J25]
MDHLNISERPGDNYVLLEIMGTINSYTYSDFQQRVYTLIDQTNLVLDMSRVSSLSSSGLGVLMSAIEIGQERGHKLYILNPSEIVRLAIESTGFPELFQIIRSIHEVR